MAHVRDFNRWRGARDIPEEPVPRAILGQGVTYHVMLQGAEQIDVNPGSYAQVIALTIRHYDLGQLVPRNRTGRSQVIVSAFFQWRDVNPENGVVALLRHGRNEAGNGIGRRGLLLSIQQQDRDYTFTRWIREMHSRLADLDANNGLFHESTGVVTLMQLYYTILPIPNRGGCESKNAQIGEIPLAFRYHSPKSKENNCLFACLRKAAGEEKKKFPLSNTIRWELRISEKVPISFDDTLTMTKVAKYFKLHVRVFDARKNLLAEYNTPEEKKADLFFSLIDPDDLRGSRQDSDRLGSKADVPPLSNKKKRWRADEFELSRGHYALITNWGTATEQKCEACGQKFLHKHTCNSEVASYWQSMFGKSTMLTPSIYRVFSADVEDAPRLCRDVVFADFETRRQEKTGLERPYAYGVLDSSTLSEADYQLLLEPSRVEVGDRARVLQLPMTHYGGLDDTLAHFAEHVLAPMKNKKICFYNGAKFDVPIALAEVLESRDFIVHRILMSAGRILALSFVSKAQVDQASYAKMRELERYVEKLRDGMDYVKPTDGKTFSMTVEEMDSTEFGDVIAADEEELRKFVAEVDVKKTRFLFTAEEYRHACELVSEEIHKVRTVYTKEDGEEKRSRKETTFEHLLEIKPGTDGNVSLSVIAKVHLKRCLCASLRALEATMGFNSIWDTYLFTQPSSLANASLAYGVPAWAGKGDFDHDSIRGEADIHRLKPLLDIYLRKDLLALAILTIRFVSECCVTFQREFKGKNFKTLVPLGGAVTASGKRSKVETKVRGPNVLNFMTMGQFTFEMWKCWSPEAWKIKLLRFDQWRFAKQAIYGGQVHASIEEVNHFKNEEERRHVFRIAEQWRKLEAEREVFDKKIQTLSTGMQTVHTSESKVALERLALVEERLKMQGTHVYHAERKTYGVKVDANSLYPSVMATEEYSTQMGWAPPTFDFKEATARFNEKPETMDRGIYLVNVIPNPKWTHPLLPYRACKDYKVKDLAHDGESVFLFEHSLNRHQGTTSGLHWNNLPRLGFYTSIDLQYAIQHGARIKTIYRALLTTRTGAIFKDYIGFLSKQRQEASARGDKVKKEILKIAMNSLYGKMAQKAIFTRQRILHGLKDWVDFNLLCELISCRELEDGRLLVEGTLRSVVHRGQTIRKPYQVAAEILSFSKRLMNEAIRTFNPDFTAHVASYGDTDSIAAPAWIEERFAAAGLMHPTELCKFKNEYNEYDAKGQVTKRGKCLFEKNHGLKDYGEIVVFSDGKVKSFLKAKGIPLGKESYDEKGAPQGKIGRAISLEEFVSGVCMDTRFLTFKRYLPNRLTSLSNGHLAAVQREYAVRKLHKTPYDRWILDPTSKFRYPPGHQMHRLLERPDPEDWELAELMEELVVDQEEDWELLIC